MNADDFEKYLTGAPDYGRPAEREIPPRRRKGKRRQPRRTPFLSALGYALIPVIIAILLWKVFIAYTQMDREPPSGRYTPAEQRERDAWRDGHDHRW
jgi:hypothetical protein